MRARWEGELRGFVVFAGRHPCLRHRWLARAIQPLQRCRWRFGLRIAFSAALCRTDLLAGEGDGYLHSEDIEGCKSFGVWPLTQAARACFGTSEWPDDRPVPRATIEFEVADADTV